jgi:protein TonB
MSSSLAAHALPSAPAPRRRPDLERAAGLSRAQLGAVVGAIGLVHVVGVWALLQVPEVREAAAEVAPIFVNFVAPPAPPKPAQPVPAPPPELAPPPPKPTPPRETLVTAAPTPAPAPFVAEPPPPPPSPVPAPPAPPVAAEASPAPPAPAPAPAPKTIPASAVQYLVAPELEYPRASHRLRESGRVMVRAFIDEAGAVREAQVHKSSSFPRLDEEAVRAVKRARFKPYLENGRATAGWAFIPLTFELEN